MPATTTRPASTHNHITRDIKPFGACAACDNVHLASAVQTPPDLAKHFAEAAEIHHLRSLDLNDKKEYCACGWISVGDPILGFTFEEHFALEAAAYPQALLAYLLRINHSLVEHIAELGARQTTADRVTK